MILVCELSLHLCLQAGETWMVDVPLNSTGGNMSHTAPEVLNALAILRTGALSARVDYGGQATFELGLVLHEVALRKSPIPDYPMACKDETGSSVHYSDASLCADVTDATALAEAGYPEEFLPLIRRMVAFNPRDRPSLDSALAEFDCMFGRGGGAVDSTELDRITSLLVCTIHVVAYDVLVEFHSC